METREDAMTEDSVMQWKIAAGKREVTVELHHKGEPLGHYVFTNYGELDAFMRRLRTASLEAFGIDMGGGGFGRGSAGSMVGGDSGVCIGYGPVVYAGPNGIAGGGGYGSGASAQTRGIGAGCAGPSPHLKTPSPASE